MSQPEVGSCLRAKRPAAGVAARSWVAPRPAASKNPRRSAAALGGAHRRFESSSQVVDEGAWRAPNDGTGRWTGSRRWTLLWGDELVSFVPAGTGRPQTTGQPNASCFGHEPFSAATPGTHAASDGGTTETTSTAAADGYASTDVRVRAIGRKVSCPTWT